MITEVTLETEFDTTGQDEQWRNEVAKELNILLARALYFRETSNDESDREAERATLSIVERVANFEDILTTEQVEPRRPRRRR